jgi:hypothetical protein
LSKRRPGGGFVPAFLVRSDMHHQIARVHHANSAGSCQQSGLRRRCGMRRDSVW